MSRILAASCVAGVVMVDGLPVAGATILSEGIASSSGVLVIDEDKTTYIAKTSPDLKTTIEKIIDALTQTKAALDQVVTALNQTGTTFTATFAGMTGPTTAPPPTGPAGVTAIVSAATSVTAAGVQLDLIKTAATALKEALK